MGNPLQSIDMAQDMTPQIKSADWGERSRILTDHLKKQILQGHWAVGQKLPSARQLAQTYDTSLETVRSALRELHGQGLIVTRARSGSVVRDKSASQDKPAGQVVAYVRMFDVSMLPQGSSYSDILPALEARLLERGLHLALVTEKPDAPDRSQRLLSRLEAISHTLAGVIMPRPPEDLLHGVLPLLESKGIPYLLVGRRRHDDMHNTVEPDYIGMGKVIGKYLAALDVQCIWMPTPSLTQPHTYSGIERCQGIVAGYLMQGKAVPVIQPIECPDNSEQAGREQVARHLKRAKARPQAIVGFGDRMALGAMRACMEAGLKVPRDVVVFGTTGLPEAAFFSPTLTTADQQSSLLAETAVDMMMDMIERRSMICQSRLTPVRYIFRQSTRMTSAAREALAEELAAGLVVESISA